MTCLGIGVDDNDKNSLAPRAERDNPRLVVSILLSPALSAVMTSQFATVSAAASSSAAGGASQHAWEDLGASGGANVWEKAVQEDSEGRIVVAHGAGSIVQAIRNRRRRLEQNDYAQRNKRLVRDMIRYVYVVVDASRWMRVKDPVLPPGTRLETTIAILQEFVSSFYDENPLSHLGFVLAKDGEAEILTPLSSSSKTQKMALQTVGPMVAAEGAKAGGEFSLQNCLEVAGRSLGHQPRHGSREIVVLTAALSTCDPGSILTETLPRLAQAQIRVSCLALSAELHICRKVAEETKGSMGVCLDRTHFRQWLLQQTVPPPSHRKQEGEGGGPVCDMIAMGFPTRTVAEVPALVHGDRNKTVMGRTAYTCPQCRTLVCLVAHPVPLPKTVLPRKANLSFALFLLEQRPRMPNYRPTAPSVA
jgi:transcription initiation factor TFIIH subunit 2